MAEYIYEIEDYEDDESEVFIGWIRHNFPQLIRCKDCEVASRCLMYRSNKDSYGFCKWAERKEE